MNRLVDHDWPRFDPRQRYIVVERCLRHPASFHLRFLDLTLPSISLQTSSSELLISPRGGVLLRISTAAPPSPHLLWQAPGFQCLSLIGFSTSEQDGRRFSVFSLTAGVILVADYSMANESAGSLHQDAFQGFAAHPDPQSRPTPARYA